MLISLVILAGCGKSSSDKAPAEEPNNQTELADKDSTTPPVKQPGEDTENPTVDTEDENETCPQGDADCQDHGTPEPTPTPTPTPTPVVDDEDEDTELEPPLFELSFDKASGSWAKEPYIIQSRKFSHLNTVPIKLEIKREYIQSADECILQIADRFGPRLRVPTGEDVAAGGYYTRYSFGTMDLYQIPLVLGTVGISTMKTELTCQVDGRLETTEKTYDIYLLDQCDALKPADEILSLTAGFSYGLNSQIDCKYVSSPEEYVAMPLITIETKDGIRVSGPRSVNTFTIDDAQEFILKAKLKAAHRQNLAELTCEIALVNSNGYALETFPLRLSDANSNTEEGNYVFEATKIPELETEQELHGVCMLSYQFTGARAKDTERHLYETINNAAATAAE
ncbi:MAG: hypothetical protein HRU19_12625 [Pseudobacteriovorax sp.]|nr:hypothetical protein [Pseudobacteriovorax sp.]